MNVILLGAPGAGKGTQAEVIRERLNVPTVSTGNIIREALKSGTEFGLKAKSYIDQGHLVPDEVIIGIVFERISEDDCKNGFILDGFPRTVAQAEALDNANVKIDKVIDIEVDDDVIYQRLSGRRVCKDCSKNYNVNNVGTKPKVDGVCDKCAGTLIQRADDKLETVKERIRIYNEQTRVLKSYYDKQNKRFVIVGKEPLEAVTEEIIKAIEA